MRAATHVGALILGLLLHTLSAEEATPGLRPSLQRIDLQPQQVAEVVFTVHAAATTQVTTAVVDCACIHLLTQLPAPVPASGSLDVRFRVTGMRPGVEDILVATSEGILRAQVQIVGPGAGRGADQLRAALDEAAARRWSVIGIAHDLRGQVRHCGCSQGALGGAGRLAQLPAQAAALRAEVPTTWILSGAVDGMRSGVGERLATQGWRREDPRVRVADDPSPLLGAPGIVAVISTGPVAIEHRRLVRPVLMEGMAVELLSVDAAGLIQARHTMPVDDSLPDDPAWTHMFRDALSRTITADANPSQTCATCHASAYAAWLTTRHARALDSLPPADRTDTCIGCHTTPLTAATLAPMVSCQSCHLGTAAHVAANGLARTSGTSDCRSCHDARHHPAFAQEPAWRSIVHGR